MNKFVAGLLFYKQAEQIIIILLFPVSFLHLLFN